MSCIQFYRIYIERKCIFPFFSSCDGWFSLDFSYVHIAFKFRNLTSLHWGLSCHLHKFRAGGTMGARGPLPSPYFVRFRVKTAVPSNNNLHITFSPPRFSVFPPSLNNAVGMEGGLSSQIYESWTEFAESKDYFLTYVNFCTI